MNSEYSDQVEADSRLISEVSILVEILQSEELGDLERAEAAFSLYHVSVENAWNDTMSTFLNDVRDFLVYCSLEEAMRVILQAGAAPCSSARSGIMQWLIFCRNMIDHWKLASALGEAVLPPWLFDDFIEFWLEGRYAWELIPVLGEIFVSCDDFFNNWARRVTATSESALARCHVEQILWDFINHKRASMTTDTTQTVLDVVEWLFKDGTAHTSPDFTEYRNKRDVASIVLVHLFEASRSMHEILFLCCRISPTHEAFPGLVDLYGQAFLEPKVAEMETRPQDVCAEAFATLANLGFHARVEKRIIDAMPGMEMHELEDLLESLPFFDSLTHRFLDHAIEALLRWGKDSGIASTAFQGLVGAAWRTNYHWRAFERHLREKTWKAEEDLGETCAILAASASFQIQIGRSVEDAARNLLRTHWSIIEALAILFKGSEDARQTARDFVGDLEPDQRGLLEVAKLLEASDSTPIEVWVDRTQDLAGRVLLQRHPRLPEYTQLRPALTKAFRRFAHTPHCLGERLAFLGAFVNFESSTTLDATQIVLDLAGAVLRS